MLDKVHELEVSFGLPLSWPGGPPLRFLADFGSRGWSWRLRRAAKQPTAPKIHWLHPAMASLEIPTAGLEVDRMSVRQLKAELAARDVEIAHCRASEGSRASTSSERTRNCLKSKGLASKSTSRGRLSPCVHLCRSSGRAAHLVEQGEDGGALGRWQLRKAKESKPRGPNCGSL